MKSHVVHTDLIIIIQTIPVVAIWSTTGLIPTGLGMVLLNLSTFGGGFFRSLPGEKGEKGGATEKEKEKARQIGEMIQFDDYFQLGCNYQMVVILFLRSMKYDDLILRGTSEKFVTCASEYCGSFTFEAMHFGCPSHPLCKILKNQP